MVSRRCGRALLPRVDRRVETLQDTRGFVSQAAFVSIGFLLVWRVTDAWLPVNIAGMWLLTCAADLQRLSARYPAGSPPAHQRKAVRRRLVHLAAVGAATGLVAAVARVADLPLRLTAVLLLAVFVVVVIAWFAGRLGEATPSQPSR